mgnify:CR=1 FL=1
MDNSTICELFIGAKCTYTSIYEKNTSFFFSNGTINILTAYNKHIDPADKHRFKIISIDITNSKLGAMLRNRNNG